MSRLQCLRKQGDGDIVNNAALIVLLSARVLFLHGLSPKDIGQSSLSCKLSPLKCLVKCILLDILRFFFIEK